MPLIVGLGVGLVSGLVAVPLNRLWATLLVLTPLAGWFVVLTRSTSDGLTGSETTRLAFGLLGILLGLAIGQAFDRRDHPGRPSR
jgi:hypothetical protein